MPSFDDSGERSTWQLNNSARSAIKTTTLFIDYFARRDSPLVNPAISLKSFSLNRLAPAGTILWYIVPMSLVQRTICKCDSCSHEWIPEHEDKSGEPTGRLPKRCPSRECRSTRWNASENGNPYPKSGNKPVRIGLQLFGTELPAPVLSANPQNNVPE